MRELAILVFATLDGVMQAPSSPQEEAHAFRVRLANAIHCD